MQNKNIKTDDQSFRKYLNSICHNSLFEHASATMLPDLVIEIILRYDHLYKDCFFCLGKEVDANRDDLKDLLERELYAVKEEKIIDLMNHIFSRKQMTDILLECTDEYAREDIIYNQNYWIENKVCGIDHNYAQFK